MTWGWCLLQGRVCVHCRPVATVLGDNSEVAGEEYGGETVCSARGSCVAEVGTACLDTEVRSQVRNGTWAILLEFYWVMIPKNTRFVVQEYATVCRKCRQIELW